MANYILENEILKVTIRSQGAELISIMKKETATEYLWCADKKYWEWTSPILFPLVGGLRDKQYTYEGKTYPMMQHGFARDYEHEVTEQSETQIWFAFSDTEETQKIYPFAFKLEIGYVLEGNNIQVKWRVTNTDNKTLYFSIGAHPAFMCPLNGNGVQTDYYLGFETDKDELQYKLIDLSCNLIADKEYPLPLENGLYQLTKDRFDLDALVIEEKQTGKMWLAGPDKKPYVTVTFDTPLFGIWSPAKKDAPFVCIEPWYGRSDGCEFYGSWEERKYGNQLEPKEVFERGYLITINE